MSVALSTTPACDVVAVASHLTRFEIVVLTLLEPLYSATYQEEEGLVLVVCQLISRGGLSHTGVEEAQVLFR